MARVNTMPGAPSELDILKTQAAAEIEKGPSGKYVWYQEPRGAHSNQFPIVPFRADPYDEIYSRKLNKAARHDDINWTVPYTESDAAYEMRKRTDDEQARFDAWIMQKYDLSDPAQNLMLQQMVPSLFKRREELIDSTQDLITKYAKSRLRGAKSEDDLRLEWLIETNRLELPTAPVWDPNMWYHSTVIQETAKDPTVNQNGGRAMENRYQRGYLSVLSWLDGDTSGWGPNANNKADIRGNPQVRYLAEGQSRGVTRQLGRVPFYSIEDINNYGDYAKTGFRRANVVQAQNPQQQEA